MTDDNPTARITIEEHAMPKPHIPFNQRSQVQAWETRLNILRRELDELEHAAAIGGAPPSARKRIEELKKGIEETGHHYEVALNAQAVADAAEIEADEKAALLAEFEAQEAREKSQRLEKFMASRSR